MIKFTLISILVLPWLSLYYMKNHAIKRYLPVAIFTSLIMTIMFEIAYTYEWWIIHEYIFPWGYITDVSFVYGLYAVGTMWIFYYTYHNFWVYLITHFSFDFMVAYIVLNFLDQSKVLTLKNISEWQYLLVSFAVSIILYGYQLWQEKIFVKNT